MRSIARAACGVALAFTAAASPVFEGLVLDYDAAADDGADAAWVNLGPPADRSWLLATGTHAVARSAVDPAPSLPGLGAAYVFTGGPGLPAGAVMTNLEAYGAGDFTVELWFRPDQPQAAATQVLWEAGGDVGASLVRRGTNLCFALDDGASNTNLGAIVEAPLVAGAGNDGFIHVVGVADLAPGGGGTARLYLNGAPIGSAALPAGFATWGGLSGCGLGTIGGQGVPAETASGGQLGGNDQLANGAGYGPFAGLIAAFRFYDRALSGGEMLRSYEAARVPSASAPQPPRPPNFVVMLCDDLGWNDVGCYTYPSLQQPGPPPLPFTNNTANPPAPNSCYDTNRPGNTLTPVLDRMAREGIRLTSFYSGAPVCTPTRAALLTGSYPRRVDLDAVLSSGATKGLSTRELTVAGLLKERGYATGCVGKWHVGHLPQFLPTRHGFDEYFGLPYSNDMSPLYLHLNENTNWQYVGSVPTNQMLLTGLYAERAVDFIRRNARRPFFLYLAQSMPHIPVYPSPAFAGASGRGNYYDVVMEIDWSIGRVLESIRSLGLDTNTLMLFTSDNGPWGGVSNPNYTNRAYGSAYPLREVKSTTWEGGMRVPCIARWPGHIPTGRVSDAVSGVIDILPTLTRLAGGGPPTDRTIDGRDLWPVLSGQWTPSPHQAYYYYHSSGTLQAMRSGPWKLREVSGTTNLFNLDADMQEMTNVAAAYPDVVAHLQAMRADFAAEMTAHGRASETFASLQIMPDTNRTAVAEGGSASMRIRLSEMPATSLLVQVSRLSGDADVAVTSGATLAFTTNNWSTGLDVTFAAAPDADTLDGVAVFRCESPSIVPVRTLYVSESDGDAAPGPAVALTRPGRAPVFLPDPAPALLAAAAGTVNGVTNPAGLTWTWAAAGPAAAGLEHPAADESRVTFPAAGAYTVSVSAAFAGLAATASFPAVVGAVTAAPAAGLEARWPLEGPSGDVAADATGNGHEGALSGNPMWRAGEGRLGGALRFDGAGDCVTVPDSAAINLAVVTARTVSLWFNPAGAGAPAGNQVLFEEGGTTRGLSLYLSGGALYAGAWGGLYGWTNTYLAASGTVAGGAWRHAAFVLDGGTSLRPDGFRAYLDGVRFAAAAAAAMSNHTDNTGLGGVAENTRLHTGSTAAAPFAGLLDEVRLYNRALSDAEILRLASEPLNLPPAVDAGPSQTVAFTSAANLAGSVSDDGLPAPVISLRWTREAGAGAAVIAPSNAASASAAFTLPGAHRLRLAADDGEFSVADDTWVQVLPLTYAEWAAALALPPGQGGPNDDPDGDGWVNFIEFATGASPTNADLSPLVRLGASPAPAQLRAEFDRPPDRAPSALADASVDLTAWWPTNLVPDMIPLSNGATRVRFTLPAAPAAPAGGLRLRFGP